MEWPFTGRAEDHRRAVASLTSGGHGGLIVTGPAHVGRTRFVREVSSALRRVPCIHLRVTRSTRAIPFAGLGEHAPPLRDRPDTWLAHLRDRLPAGSVLVVDDAQWLDEHSAQAVHDLVAVGHVRALAAVREGHRVPGAISQLWARDLVVRIDIGPLDRPAIEGLLTAALGGPVGAEARRELWSLTQGYPLLLKDLVEDLVEGGTLRLDDDAWVLDGPVHAPRRTVDAVAEILADFGDEIAHAVHLIAIGEPLDAGVLDQLATPDILTRIERSGIAMLDPVDGRYRFRAPAACMAVQAGLVPAQVRALARELAAATATDPAELEGDDLLRYVRWRLDAGGASLDHDTLIRAAEVAAAQFDHLAAERIARAALPGGGARALLRLASALVAQDRAEEAEQALADAVERSGDDGERFGATVQRSRLLMFGLGRPEPAIRLLSEALERQGPGPERDDATTLLAMMLSHDGDLTGSVALARPLVESDATLPAARAMGASSLAFALGMRGQIDEAMAVTRRMLELPADEVESGQPLARHLLELSLMMGFVYRGDLHVAESYGSDAYEVALATGADEVAGVWAIQLAACHIFAGRIARASTYAGEARRLLTGADAISALPLACAQGAVAAAEAGDVDAAAEWLQRLTAERRLADTRGSLLELRARTGLLAARGELAAAAAHAEDVADRALTVEHRVWAVMSLHQAVRYGYPEGVADRIDELASGIDGRFIAGMAAHARALAAEDIAGLEQASTAFAELGALLYAAECAAQGAGLAARGDEAQRAAGLRARARALLAHCRGARTPALAALDGEPLTRREREVALLAARGESSRSIAERLYLSTRTVDNHLSSVYRKLGVAGRGELAGALAVDADGPSDT